MKKILGIVLVAALSCVLAAGCSNSAGSASGAASGSASASASASASSSSAASTASSAASGDAQQAITADMIADGTYEIEVKSSSSMFRPIKCELVVADGKMVAVMTLSGHGYEKLYMGTAEQAANASDDQFIMFTDEDGDGKYTYTVPVEALDVEIDCTAYSIKRQTWYDRKLVFQSGNIPADKITR